MTSPYFKTHLNSNHYARSDESDMWKKHPDVLKVCNGESGWAFGADGDDGIFWMDFEDFVQVRYVTFYCCNPFVIIFS